MSQGTSGGWIAFAAMAFIVAGLAGVFATYALPIPMERAFAVDAALDEALIAARGPDPDRAIAALASRLGESAAPLAQGTGSWEDRIQRERAAMRARFIAEEEATATRLRWLVVVVNLMGAMFVGAVVSIVSRRPVDSGS
jgi:hypothetical protein